jgi:hypothetical protein
LVVADTAANTTAETATPLAVVTAAASKAA